MQFFVFESWLSYNWDFERTRRVAEEFKILDKNDIENIF